jgi:hypothetical protein
MDSTDDVARNTVARRVNTAEKPKRQSFIHHHKSNIALPQITPRIIKNSQKIQQKRESATVLLRTKMGSRLRTSLLTT